MEVFGAIDQISNQEEKIIQELQKISQSFMNNLIHILKLPKTQIAKLKPEIQKEIKTLPYSYTPLLLVLCITIT